MTHPTEDRLYDYVDDLLCREERAELERHLGECGECTSFVRTERELRRAVAELPRSIEPPATVLAGIHERIDPRPLGARTLWSLRFPLAAAALVLIALTATVTSLLLRQPAGSPVVQAIPGSGVVHEVLSVEASYVAAAAELEQAVRASALRPETVAELERHLRTIDTALAEARSALARDPGNATLAELLHSAHEQKLELLRGAERLTRRIGT